jgi:predicted phage baseplate assembly protein
VPLEDHIPKLDDHTYESIIGEIRSRISRYTPEWSPVWTDFNDSDPGITMVQVFAWLAEMLTYRMNRVPELSYLKFLQLLGIELRPAEPAKAEITFRVRPTHPAPTAIVPKGTQVTAETPGGGPPLVFEAERSLVCLTARLAAVLAYDGYAYESVAEANESATEFQPLGPTANVESALLLGFDYTGPFPGTEISLFFWSGGADSPLGSDAHTRAPVSCGLPPSAAYPPATLEWEYWNGFEWSRLAVLKDETLAFTRTGEVIVKTPAASLAREVVPPEAASLYWIRARVTKSQYERPPSLLALRTNTMRLTQMETVRDEVLGGSNGRRDQIFRLASVPVLAGSLRLEIDQGSGFEAWTEVADFFASGPNELHYALNRTTGEVRFGDGFNGAIPIANINNPGANVVAREYRYGGGTYGNVAAGTLQALRNAVEGIDDNGVTNVMPSYGGRDEETLDEAKRRARAAVRSSCRAVTNEDFEHFARQAANVARARALPLFHPGYPGVQVPGVVTVVVVPDSDHPRPSPSEGMLRTVCAYLDQRRLLTTEVYVVAPTYQQVRVAVEVTARDGADLADVQRGIEASLLDYFHPLKGGEDGLGWPFGGTIYFSRVFHRVLAVPGVDVVDRLTISLDGDEAPECRDVPIRDGALVFSLSHDISVNYRVLTGAFV